MRTNRLFLALGVGLSLLLVACGSVPKPSFTLLLNPPEINASPNSDRLAVLTVTSQNGFTGTVKIEKLEAVDANNNPVPGVSVLPSAPIDLTLLANASVNVPLMVEVGLGVPAGTYTLQAKGTSGNITQQATLKLKVVQ